MTKTRLQPQQIAPRLPTQGEQLEVDKPRSAAKSGKGTIHDPATAERIVNHPLNVGIRQQTRGRADEGGRPLPIRSLASLNADLDRVPAFGPPSEEMGAQCLVCAAVEGSCVGQPIDLNALTVIRRRTVLKRRRQLESYLVSIGAPRQAAADYLERRNLRQLNALTNVMRCLPDRRLGPAAKKLAEAELWQLAADFYGFDLQPYNQATLLREQLGDAALATKVLERAGYAGLTADQCERADKAGATASPWPGMMERAAKILERASIPEANQRAIMTVLRRKYRGCPNQLPAPLDEPTARALTAAATSSLPARLGLPFITHITATSRLYLTLPDGNLTHPNKPFCLSPEPSANRDIPIRGGRGVFGGPYDEGESVVMLIRPTILERDDFHATPHWGTQGKRAEDSVDATDKLGLVRFFEAVGRLQSGQNEIVFANSSQQPVGHDLLQEIWVHPAFRDQLLAEFETRGIASPARRSWEQIIVGRLFYPRS